MSAFCPHVDSGHAYYNVSLRDLHECSVGAAIWSRGYVLGSEPHPPLDDNDFEVDDDSVEYAAWSQRVWCTARPANGRQTHLAAEPWPDPLDGL
jgi:hypothetical protein